MAEKSEKLQCSETVVYDSWGRSRTCEIAAKPKWNCGGRDYCWLHHPPSVAKRNTTKLAGWEAEARERKEAHLDKANGSRLRGIAEANGVTVEWLLDHIPEMIEEANE
jgi:hypothetical protein